jgi:hypothetical protein
MDDHVFFSGINHRSDLIILCIWKFFFLFFKLLNDGWKLLSFHSIKAYHFWMSWLLHPCNLYLSLFESAIWFWFNAYDSFVSRVIVLAETFVLHEAIKSYQDGNYIV